jgi:two-component system phosphate regulon sensor histidine kinase PhoR
MTVANAHKPDPLRRSTAKRVWIILLLIVLLPALFYSVYEINSLSNSEKLIGDIYRRQLDGILFSLNQYAWDVASTWANDITMAVRESRMLPADDGLTRFREFLGRHRAVQTIFFSDSALLNVTVVDRPGSDSLRGPGGEEIRAVLRDKSGKVQQLREYRRAEYRKIEPIRVPGAHGNSDHAALVFALDETPAGPSAAGFVLDEERFVRDVLSSKLNEAAGSEFAVAILATGTGKPVATAGTVEPGEFRQQKQLWVLPEYSVGIRLKGTTVEEILRERFYQNLVLLLILDAVLVGGAWLVYRTIRKEMELVKLKSDFVSNVSHELRTPLSLIRMFAETLEMGRLKDEEKKREYYSTIVRETERLTRLVNNMLNFSRMEAGKKQYHFLPVDLNAVVSGVMATYESHLAVEGFDPRVELDPVLPVAEADAEAMTEALINLVDNAVKYSPAEKYLRIRTGASDGAVWVEVEDHGVGIAPEHRQRIFETFYRVSEGLVRSSKGSGLGLTLVRHIMEAHGGKVTLESEIGKGSKFRLSIPLR